MRAPGGRGACECHGVGHEARGLNHAAGSGTVAAMTRPSVVLPWAVLCVLAALPARAAAPVGPQPSAACEGWLRQYEIACLAPAVESRDQFDADSDRAARLRRDAITDMTCAEIRDGAMLPCPQLIHMPVSREYLIWDKAREKAKKARQPGGGPGCPNPWGTFECS